MRFNLATVEWRREDYLIGTDPGRLDREAIWQFLRSSYWSPDIARHLVDRGIEKLARVRPVRARASDPPAGEVLRHD